MTPEQLSRKQIDRQLEASGWLVQDYRQMNISAGVGVAVREFPLTTGDADYMLYVDCKAIGVVEAKPKGHTLTGVETQSGKYLEGLPKTLPHYRLPLPFAYESTGEVTQFTNTLPKWADFVDRDEGPQSSILFNFDKVAFGFTYNSLMGLSYFHRPVLLCDCLLHRDSGRDRIKVIHRKSDHRQSLLSVEIPEA